MGDVRSVLREAYAVIKDRKHWTRGAEARGKTGDWRGRVSPTDPAADRFCAVGALRRVCEDHGLREAASALLDDCARPKFKRPDDLINRPIVSLNDSKGHAAVLEAYECAIRKAGEN